MKYIKLFEDRVDDIEFMNSLKKGDYVIIDSELYDLEDEVMILTSEPFMYADGFTVQAKDATNEIIEVFYDYEIVRKLTPQEAEFRITTKKYNL